MQTVIFTFLEFEFPYKKLLARAIGLDKVVESFEKIRKNVEDTRALCPW
jgi:hypothetical protein